MVFNEQQSLRDSFIVYVILMVEVPTLILMLVFWWTGKFGEDGFLPVAIFLAMLGLVSWFIVSLSLEVHLDRRGLKYRSFPFANKWKFIPTESIQNPKVRKIDGMMEFGGVGPRVSPKTKAFIFSTDWVLELDADGKKYAFSTRKPREMEAVLDLWKSESNT